MRFLRRVRLALRRPVMFAQERILRLADRAADRRICGRSLVKYEPSIDRDDAAGVGGTGSSATHYLILERIFSHVTLTPEDVFLDVGCGKGRVLAFLLKERAPCRLCGVEHSEVSVRTAQAWTRRYPQVTVIPGDALQLDYDPYTVLFLNRPFLPVTFLGFVERLEATVTHPVTLLYWVDQQSGRLLKDRPGWTLCFREKLEKIRGLRIAYSPQGSSVWTFDPARREGAEP